MSKISLVILILWASWGRAEPAQGVDPNAKFVPGGAGTTVNCPECDADWASSSNSQTLKRSKSDSEAIVKKAMENRFDLQKEDIELTDEEKQQAKLNQQLKGMNKPVSKEIPTQSVSDRVKKGMAVPGEKIRLKINKRGIKAVGEF